MIEKLQRQFALTPAGAKNLIKACLSCTVSYIIIAMSMGILYYFCQDVMIPILNGQIIELHIWSYIIECLIVAVLIFIAHYIQYNMTFYNTYKESARLRISMAEHLRKIPLAFFGQRDISDLTSTILSDVTYMEQALSHFIPEFVGSVVSTLLLSLGMFFFDFQMALAAVWCIPVSFLLIILARKKLNTMNKQFHQKQLYRAQMIQEGIETIRDLKSNCLTQSYLQDVDQSIDDAEKQQIKNELTNAFFVVGAQLILKLGIVSVVIVGIRLIMQNQITFSTFLLFLIVASRLYDPLNGTLQNLAAIFSCQSKIDRLNEIQDYPIQTGVEQFHPQHYDIVFDHVSFGYDKKNMVVKDVSFTAKQGEITALIGESGGGKSTCAKLAARFWDVSSGNITIDGINIATIEPETLLSKFAIVFQDVVLFNASIIENIRLGKKDASDEDVLKAAKLAYCDEFVQKLSHGYQTVIGENGAKLSGGERQRISIARALLKDAPIILLDEATASLDVESETYVQQALSELIKNKTVIMIAHRMRTIAHADHIIVLKNGQIIEEGRPEELMQQESIYKHMSELQMNTKQWIIK